MAPTLMRGGRHADAIHASGRASGVLEGHRQRRVPVHRGQVPAPPGGGASIHTRIIPNLRLIRVEIRTFSLVLTDHSDELRLNCGAKLHLENGWPSRPVPLSEGRVNEKGEIECGYHGWTFDGKARGPLALVCSPAPHHTGVYLVFIRGNARTE